MRGRDVGLGDDVGAELCRAVSSPAPGVVLALPAFGVCWLLWGVGVGARPCLPLGPRAPLPARRLRGEPRLPVVDTVLTVQCHGVSCASQRLASPLLVGSFALTVGRALSCFWF